MENNHVTVLEIDLNAIEYNLKEFKSKLLPKTKVLAVVKAFGYGSNAVEIAKFLEPKVAYF
ncbi:MAG: alanine racemase, partial [Lutibacter sp.]